MTQSFAGKFNGNKQIVDVFSSDFFYLLFAKHNLWSLVRLSDVYNGVCLNRSVPSEVLQENFEFFLSLTSTVAALITSTVVT